MGDEGEFVEGPAVRQTSERAKVALVAVAAQSALELAGAFYISITIVPSLTFLVATVLFLRWLRQAYEVAGVLRPESLRRFRSNQVIWAFILPIVSFFRPVQIVKDLFALSDPKGLPDPPRYRDVLVAHYRQATR